MIYRFRTNLKIIVYQAKFFLTQSANKLNSVLLLIIDGCTGKKKISLLIYIFFPYDWQH